MRRLEHVMAPRVHSAALLLRWLAPEEKDEPGMMLVELRDDGVRQLLPTAPLVRIRLALAHRKACVEHQNALLRPLGEAAVPWALEGHLRILLELFVPSKAPRASVRRRLPQGTGKHRGGQAGSAVVKGTGHIQQRRRDLDAVLHAEGQSMRLSRAVVWILPHNDDANLVEGAEA